MKCENPKCGKEHDGSYGSGRFCSNHCRCAFNASKAKHETLKPKIAHSKLRAPYGTWKCRQCNEVFEVRRQLAEHNKLVHPHGKDPWNKGLTKEVDRRIELGAKKTSKTLKDLYSTGMIISAIQTPDFWTKEKREIQRQRAIERKIGGYHKHGGKGHRGWYKGYWCDSSWELAWVIYNLDHGIKFERCKEKFEYEFEGKQSTYNPDFVLSTGEYVEIKGWSCLRWIAKLNAFPKDKILRIIGQSEIQKYLDYAKMVYGDDFISLYET